MSVFAQRLKELREELKLTQRQFGEKCETTGAAISAYEKGQKLPSLTVATRIAQAFHVSLDWLFGLDEAVELNKAPQTEGAFADMVIKLIEAGVPILLKTADFGLDELDELKKLGYTYRYSGGKEFICGTDGKVVDLPIRMVVLQLCNKSLASFFDGWGNLNNLRQAGTIDDNLYALWLDKQLETLKKVPLVQASQPAEPE